MKMAAKYCELQNDGGAISSYYSLGNMVTEKKLFSAHALLLATWKKKKQKTFLFSNIAYCQTVVYTVA